MTDLKKIALFLIAAAGISLPAAAQNYTDVLRYSQKYYQGTARSIGIGNAFGALGADFTAMDINPAGLGIYRNPEFSLSLDLNHQYASATYLDNVAKDDKYNLNISNLGLVITSPQSKLGQPVKEGWVSVNFAIGFQRTNNFHQNISIEGTNKNNSVLTSFKENANGAYPSQLDPFSFGYLAYYSGLIFNRQDSSQYLTIADSFENPGTFKSAFQADYMSITGSMNDINIALAGNHSNKLYIGATLNIPTVGYHYERNFHETNTSDTVKYYKSSYLKETLNTTGVGITGTLGLIYRFTDEFRGGISLQLPTFYSLSDEYSYEVGSDITIGKYSTSSDIGTFKYSIVTPSRTTLSLAYIFGKQGFISADYEYIDYSGGRINTNYEGVRQKNEEVKNVLHHASNFRIGGEYRIGMASLRAGFDWYGSPYENGMAPVNYNGSNRMLSLGFGIRDENYFVDLGFQNQLNNFFHLPYALKNANVEGATIQNYRNNFILTLGTKF